MMFATKTESTIPHSITSHLLSDSVSLKTIYTRNHDPPCREPMSLFGDTFGEYANPMRTLGFPAYRYQRRAS